MREHEDGLYGETDARFVQNEIAKAMSMFAHEMREEWKQWELSQAVDRDATGDQSAGRVGEPVEERGLRLNQAEHPAAPASPAPSSEPAPWEVDDRLEAGEEGDFRSGSEPIDHPSGGEGSGNARAVSGETPAPSTEQTTEQQPRLRLQGTVGRMPSHSVSPSGVPRIQFPLAEHVNGEDGEPTTQWHTVYSTKQFAQAIHAQELHRGEEVRVTGVKHESSKKDRSGKIMTTDGGEIVTETQVYAYAVKRVHQPNPSE